MYIITYRLKTIAMINAVHFSGGPGMGAYQLIVKAAISMQPERLPAPTAIVALRGVLRVGRGHLGLELPVAAPLHGKFVEMRCVADQSIPHHGELSATLSGAQVRALDQARSADGDLDVQVEFDVLMTGGEGPLAASVTYPARITGSDWTRVLKEMRFEDRATFEVPVDGGRVAPPLERAAKHMRGALDQVQKRDWKDALVECREVLDEVERLQGVATQPWADWADKGKRDGWRVPERVLAMQTAVRHLTHAGAHAKIGNADEPAVRLAVATTAAVLNYYASR